MGKGAKLGNTNAADSYKVRTKFHHVGGDKNREETYTETYRMGHGGKHGSRNAQYTTLKQAKRDNPDSRVQLIRYVSVTPLSAKQLAYQRSEKFTSNQFQRGSKPGAPIRASSRALVPYGR